jgi:hypothetical protein
MMTDEEDCDSDDEAPPCPPKPRATATVETIDYESDSDSDSEPSDMVDRPDDTSSEDSSDCSDGYYQDMWDMEDDNDGPVATPYNNAAKQATQLDPIPVQTRMPKHKDAWYRRQHWFFPGKGMKTIKKTFENTTQYGARGATIGPWLQHSVASPNPILNVPRRQEDVATDTISSNTPAVDNGSTAAQFFIGTTSQFRSVRPCGDSDAQFTQTLMDEIQTLGAMNRLISDKAKAQISESAMAILRTFSIDDWHIETGKPWQHPAEIGLSSTIPKIQEILNTSGAPANC